MFEYIEKFVNHRNERSQRGLTHDEMRTLHDFCTFMIEEKQKKLGVVELFIPSPLVQEHHDKSLIMESRAMIGIEIIPMIGYSVQAKENGGKFGQILNIQIPDFVIKQEKQ